MRPRTGPDWLESKIAEIEAQIGRKVTPDDLKCAEIDYAHQTVTVARNPLLAEIRSIERTRPRDLDLPEAGTEGAPASDPAAEAHSR